MKAIRDAIGEVLGYDVPCPECKVNTRFNPRYFMDRCVLNGLSPYRCQSPKCRVELRITFATARHEKLPKWDVGSTYRTVANISLIHDRYMRRN